MTTATLKKINIKDVEYLLPRDDYFEIKKISSSEGRPVLKIFVQKNGISTDETDKTDALVGLEVTLRKGKRVGLFR